MKINVRHEAATAANEPEGSEATEEQTCVWVVGEDGVTLTTSYLKPGEKVEIALSASASVVSSTGEVTEGW